MPEKMPIDKKKRVFVCVCVQYKELVLHVST